ncbi:uncharacterized protein DSM5745_04042 [Aspergillus mulundensis]|uniref:LYR motif-containing protein Cup1-like N-terminal domain-containing protein n=1 Tax=Aspergillus mulundensis TaxID=1810919 RepID=A0A3D8SBM2_9EURO|nr:Uncharacterized protein DSM5745_04042 [Aspergillus mulundensis]RDW83716.1 Uncharacterized protein DSM5745_04042 [Aspergillus mulundensis]
MPPRHLIQPSQEEWRGMLRNLLRECSYLPDPIARSTCHDQIIQRFRRYHFDPKRREENVEKLKVVGKQYGKWHADAKGEEKYLEKMMRNHKEARKSLSLLRRANEGYIKPLEKVLKNAYGRSGKKRAELVTKLLEEHSAVNSDDVNALIASADRFEKKWEVPKIITDLLKSQLSNAYAMQHGDRPMPIKRGNPPGDMKNAWERRMPIKRGSQYRRRWYHSVLEALLPPLPDADLRMLEGLMSGAVPWSPPKRRSTGQTTPSTATDNQYPKGAIIRTVLTDGPPKGETFALYRRGRPHIITRRFMCRLWKRVSCLVPRYRWDEAHNMHKFEWDTASFPPIALSAKEGSSSDIFGGIDVAPKTFKKPKEPTPYQNSLYINP